jgi:hypothetical protein
MMRTIKTYSKRAPFYNAFIRKLPQSLKSLALTGVHSVGKTVAPMSILDNAERAQANGNAVGVRFVLTELDTVPAAFTEARDKLQWACQQGDRATQSVQWKRTATLPKVFHIHWKRHVRQQVTKSLQRIHYSEECEHETKEFGQAIHDDLFCHLFLALGGMQLGEYKI